MTESSTVTSLECQKASFVLSTDPLILTPETYWNEYFPSIVRPSMSSPELSRKGYSPSREHPVMEMPWHFHPNSVDDIVQPSILMPLHPLRHFTPLTSVPVIVPSEQYQSGARHVSAIVHPLMANPSACQS